MGLVPMSPARCLVIVLATAGWPVAIDAQVPGPSDGLAALRDTIGRNDFDFEIGTWKTHVRLLTEPLSASDDWVEYEGVSEVTPILDGRANLVELRVEGTTGRIEGMSLRLYDTGARQWTLNFANVRTGRLSPPVTGEFRNGRGEFYGEDRLNGRAILVRFVISDITSTSARFEQSFSDDGGESWEANWIAVDTRMDAPSPSG